MQMVACGFECMCEVCMPVCERAWCDEAGGKDSPWPWIWSVGWIGEASGLITAGGAQHYLSSQLVTNVLTPKIAHQTLPQLLQFTFSILAVFLGRTARQFVIIIIIRILWSHTVCCYAMSICVHKFWVIIAPIFSLQVHSLYDDRYFFFLTCFLAPLKSSSLLRHTTNSQAHIITFIGIILLVTSCKLPTLFSQLG